MNDLDKKNKKEDFNQSGKKPKKKQPRRKSYTGISFALGVAVGAAIDNIGIGIGLGIAIGAIIDGYIAYKNKKQ